MNSGKDVSNKLHLRRIPRSPSYTDELLENRLQLLMTSHMPCLTGFYGPSHVHVHRQVVCRYHGPILRETIKGATTTCDRTGPPIYFYDASSGEFATVNGVRHRALCPSLTEPSFCRPSPCRRTRKISKLIYWESCRASVLWLARRIIKATAHHRTSLSPPSDVNICT